MELTAVYEPLVTVLMSVYNGEKYLIEAIESILNQTFNDFEFLIINDGSMDRSRDIIISYKDPRIRLVDNEENIGLTRSLNKGIAESRGKYIARMDADDISMPERLEKQVAYMEEHCEIAVCGTWGIVKEDERNWEARMPVTHDDIFISLIGGNALIHTSVIIRRDLVLEVGFYDEKLMFAQDYGLWFKFIAKGYKLNNIPEFLIQYNYHSNSISKSKKNNQESFAVEAVIKGFKDVFNLSFRKEHILMFRACIRGDMCGEKEKKVAIKVIKKINNKIKVNYSNLYLLFKEKYFI